MTARLAQANQLDANGILNAYANSLTVKRNRWPVSLGGPAAIRTWDLPFLQALRVDPMRRIVISDQQSIGGPRVATSMLLHEYANNMVEIEDLSVTYAANRPATITRLRRGLLETLVFIANNTPPTQVIRAALPNVPEDDTDDVTTIRKLTGQMRVNNGVAHQVIGDLVVWTVTSAQILQGVSGISP